MRMWPEEGFVYCMLTHRILYVRAVAMKRHGDDNEDKQLDKRPRFQQVSLQTTLHIPYAINSRLFIFHQKAAQAHAGLVALPSALARLLLRFLPGRAIPSLLGVSHTARRLCAYLYELNMSSCRKMVGLCRRL